MPFATNENSDKLWTTYGLSDYHSLLGVYHPPGVFVSNHEVVVSLLLFRSYVDSALFIILIVYLPKFLTPHPPVFYLTPLPPPYYHNLTHTPPIDTNYHTHPYTQPDLHTINSLHTLLSKTHPKEMPYPTAK